MLKTLPKTVIVALLVSALSTATLANGVPPAPQPSTTSAPAVHYNGTNSSESSSASTSSSDSRAAAAANSSSSVGNVGGGRAAANAQGGTAAGGTAQAAGGAGGAGGSVGDNSSGATINDTGSSSFKALAVSLPPPVFTPPLPVTCSNAEASNEAVAVGWNFFSKASGNTSAADCTLLQLRAAKIERCAYLSAKRIEDALAAKHLGKSFTAEPAPTGLSDLSPAECEESKRPPVLVASVQAPAPASAPVLASSLFVGTEPALACTEPSAAPAKRRSPVAKRGCGK